MDAIARPMPTFNTVLPAQFVANFKARCTAVSAGRLNDFNPASDLTALAEVLGQSIEEDINQILDQVFPELIAASWELLGIPRIQASRAVCNVRFELTGKLNDPFPIGKGYRFAVKGQVFETQLDLQIPAQTDTTDVNNYPACQVGAIALNPGTAGNVDKRQGEILNPVTGLAAVFLDEDAAGGKGLEDLETYRDRIAAILARNASTAIVLPADYERVVIEQLGAGSVAIAVPERNLQGQSSIAAMSVWALAPNGAAPTPAQLAELSAAIAPLAPLSQGRLYFGFMTVSVVNVTIGIKPLATGSVDAIASAVNTAVRSVFSIENTAGTKALDIYLLVKTVYGVSGIDYADPAWSFSGDPLPEARRLQLPVLPGSAKNQPAKIGTVTINFTNGIVKTFSS